MLPQDIVTLIIDEFASQFDDVWHLARLQSLRTCALVCKSFYYASRKHLFAHIDFYADRHGQKRAANLVRILEHESNKDLVPNIRSVRLRDGPAYGPPRKFPSKLLRLRRMYRAAKEGIKQLAKDAGLQADHIERLLFILCSAPVQSFAFEGNMWTLASSGTIKNYSIIADMRSKPSLEFLSLSNIAHLDPKIFTGNFQSSNLRALELSFVECDPHFASFPLKKCGPVSTTFATIETLKLGRLNYRNFFLMTQFHSQSPLFANLRILSISLSVDAYAMDTVWQSICNFGKTLETLELRNNNSPGGTLGFYEPNNDAFLSGLRALKLSACALNTTLDLNHKVAPFIKFLTSPKTPLHVFESLSLEFFFCMSMRQRELGVTFTLKMRQEAPHPIWRALDNALADPSFVQLRTVVLRIRPFYFDSSLTSEHFKREDDDFNLARYLPKLLSWHPSMKVTTVVEAIYSPKDMLTYLRKY